MTVRRVFVQVRRPQGDDVGQISEGFYVVEGGLLSLVQPDGELMPFSHRLLPGDDADAIARVLTKKARRERLGLSADQESFGRRLNYGPIGIA